MSIPRFYPSCLGLHSCQIRKWLGSGKPIWHVTLHPELISHHPLLCQTAFLCPDPARSEKTNLQESMLGTNRQIRPRANDIHMLSQRKEKVQWDLFNISVPSPAIRLNENTTVNLRNVSKRSDLPREKAQNHIRNSILSHQMIRDIHFIALNSYVSTFDLVLLFLRNIKINISGKVHTVLQ